MELAAIYRCLADETRARILHLLARRPLCVCHFQQILRLPQVAISQRLSYLRAHGLVAARRHEQWRIYHLPEPQPRELRLQLECLLACAERESAFQGDLARLRAMGCECEWVVEAVKPSRKRKNK